jgi:hypothetical protein
MMCIALASMCICDGLRCPLRLHQPLRSFSRMYEEKPSFESGQGFGKSTQAPVLVSEEEGGEVDEQMEIKLQEISQKDAATLTVEEKILSTTMFQRQKSRKEDILAEKIQKLREEDELLASDPSVGAVPELVADRMIRRIAVFFGVPVFGGLSIFVGAFFYGRSNNLVVPPALIAYATQLPFVLGLVGITYGILSSSWDTVSVGVYVGVVWYVVCVVWCVVWGVWAVVWRGEWRVACGMCAV